MTRITTLDLPQLYRNSIGLDSIFDSLLGRIEHNQSNYPPYNIVKSDDDHYTIEIAVAGFAQGDIDIQVKEGELIITGAKSDEDDTQYLHHGIGTRKFTRTFNLAEYVEVKSADVENGVLSIALERNIPEAMKPKSIAINYKS
tara:strand:- start:915 stop:1343 length:429 start_codon:yes stop_codon:yes gene_type:complete